MVTAATVVSAEAVPSNSYTLILENRRESGIEAFGYDKFEPTGTPQGTVGEDYYLTDPARPTPGRGRVQPHERRDLYQQYQDPAPIVRLSYVMYDDHVFEGDASQREKLLSRREEDADEYPYALATLSEAMTKPPGEIEAFLVGRLAARIKQTQPQGKYHPPTGPIDTMLRAVRLSPEQFLKDAAAMRAKFEQQYQRLTQDIAALRK